MKIETRRPLGTGTFSALFAFANWAIAILGGGIGSKKFFLNKIQNLVILHRIPFRSYSRPEILDLILYFDFRYYSHKIVK